MVVAFTSSQNSVKATTILPLQPLNRNKLFSGKPIFRCGTAPFSSIFVALRSFRCAICLVADIATKTAMAFSKIIYHILLGAHHAELFPNKCSLYIQFDKLLGLWFYVDFFLNLGFHYNAVEYRHKYLSRQHISIRKTFMLYIIYDAVTERVPINNAGIESFGSAG